MTLTRFFLPCTLASNLMKPSKSLSWVIFSVMVLAAGAGWILLSRADPGDTTSGMIPAPRAEFLAPQFTLKTSDDQTVSLSDLRGRPVLVNFWASWCTPCQAEMPAMQRVYQDFKGQGLEILAVNATYQDDPQVALNYVLEHELTFPILYDSNADSARLFQVRALPTSFFIDEQGIIRDVVVGGPMAEALLRIRVKELLENHSQTQERQ